MQGLNYVPIESLKHDEQMGYWTSSYEETSDDGQVHQASEIAWVNRKNLTNLGYPDELLTEYFGDPFIYKGEDIWAYPHVLHVEKILLLPAAKMARGWLDSEVGADLIERHRFDE